MQRLIIYNPRARGSRGDRIRRRIASELTAAGLKYQLEVAETSQAAVELSRQAAGQRFDQVIAAGGDGTVNAVINGLAGSPSALGIIPLGTANALGKNIGLPDGDIRAAVQVIAQARVRRIDLGIINGRYFGTMAGVGLDAQVAHGVKNAWKQWLGKLAFVGQFVTTTICCQPAQFDLHLDGEQSLNIAEQLWAVIICNFPLYTWRLRFVPQAQPDDGHLDVVIFRFGGYRHLLGPVSRSFLRGAGVAENPYVSVTNAHRIRISAQPSCWWQVDGDVGGQTPVDIHVAPKKLNLIIPPAD